MPIIALIIPSFIAGLLTFLAPCTLPIVPGYLSFISGVSSRDLEDKEKARKARRKIFFNGLFFIIGFTLIFIVFGTLAGFLGRTLAVSRVWLSRVGGAFVILFGLFLLGIFKLPFLQKERRLAPPKFFTPGKPISSLTMGSAFAFGWTPCVGPILGSILLLASTTTTAFQGAFLLSVFSVGLAIPFLLMALLFSQATKFIRQISKYLKVVSIIGGLFLIFLGALLLTNNFGLLVQYGYKLFEFINYDALLDKL